MIDKLQSMIELIKGIKSKRKKIVVTLFLVIAIIVAKLFDKIDFSTFTKFAHKIMQWIYGLLVNNFFWAILSVIIIVVCVTLYKCKRMNFIRNIITAYLNSDCGKRNGFRKIKVKKNKEEMEITIESQINSRNTENIGNKNIIPYNKINEKKQNNTKK